MNKSKLAITLLPLFLIFAIVLFFSSYENESFINIPQKDKHRGVCWVAGPREVNSEALGTLVAHNVNWISQTPFGWQRGFDNPEIGTNHKSKNETSSVWWGERDEGIQSTTRMAKKAGIKTILKPHLWLNDKSGKWRGEIKMKSEADWKKWFEEYTNFILHYAKLAEEENIEMFCIGTELHQTCIDRDADWRLLISKIRKVYSGDLTYAANFSDEYQDVRFWDELDYIGIQAYFPLVQGEQPTIEEVQEGWKSPIKQLQKISNKHKKPILFTEVGYKSTKDAGIEPWVWPSREGIEERKSSFSEETQAILYEGLFSEVWDQPWLAGIHIWKWYPGGSTSNRRRQQEFNIDFTPQNKMAEGVISNWYNKTK